MFQQTREQSLKRELDEARESYASAIEAKIEAEKAVKAAEYKLKEYLDYNASDIDYAFYEGGNQIKD
jgi:hypothetical protein